MRPRSGPILPPTPFIEWQLEQPFEPNTRDPAKGSCAGAKIFWQYEIDAKQKIEKKTVNASLHMNGVMLVRAGFLARQHSVAHREIATA
jgi:hypothetical protein